jgi:FkbM family methyltransferase
VIGALLIRAGLAQRAWRYRRRVDPDGIRWLLGALGPGDGAIDVGAHKGGYTYWMRRAVGDSGAVVAFEPQPELHDYLRRCARSFRWTNVRVAACALSSSRGRRVLRLPADAPSPAASLVGASLPSGARGYEVDVDTLDLFLAENPLPGRVRVVKCDVEGEELEVLRGARRTLEAHRPLILVECEARHTPSGSVHEVFAHLHTLGYEGHFRWQGARMELEHFDASLHQVQGRRPYVNNFFFEP